MMSLLKKHGAWRMAETIYISYRNVNRNMCNINNRSSGVKYRGIAYVLFCHRSLYHFHVCWP